MHEFGLKEQIKPNWHIFDNQTDAVYYIDKNILFNMNLRHN
jgi:hypothetical protein